MKRVLALWLDCLGIMTFLSVPKNLGKVGTHGAGLFVHGGIAN